MLACFFNLDSGFTATLRALLLTFPSACRGLVHAFGALCLCVTGVGYAASVAPVPSPPHFDVTSYVLMDVASGHLIVTKQPARRMAPGSLAKLMTLYVVFADLANGRIHLDDRVHIDEEVWKIHGTQMFLRVGTEVPVADLIRGVIVDSANDASVALAKFVAGTQQAFVRYMNQFAHKLGMHNTHFTNAGGLPDPDMYTTAADMALLARALIRRLPQYYRFFDQISFTFNGITQRNHNDLLWRDQTVDGLKTGSAADAGFHLVASAKRGNDRLISVVMGGDSASDRTNAGEALLNYGFRFYRTRELYAAGSRVLQEPIWKGARDRISIGLAHPVYVTVPKHAGDALQAKVRIPARLIAPLEQGQTVGKLEISLGDAVLAHAPLVALETVPRGGWWTRLTDSVALSVRAKLHDWFPELTKAATSN